MLKNFEVLNLIVSAPVPSIITFNMQCHYVIKINTIHLHVQVIKIRFNRFNQTEYVGVDPNSEHVNMRKH